MTCCGIWWLFWPTPTIWGAIRCARPARRLLRLDSTISADAVPDDTIPTKTGRRGGSIETTTAAATARPARTKGAMTGIKTVRRGRTNGGTTVTKIDRRDVTMVRALRVREIEAGIATMGLRAATPESRVTTDSFTSDNKCYEFRMSGGWRGAGHRLGQPLLRRAVTEYGRCP